MCASEYLRLTFYWEISSFIKILEFCGWSCSQTKKIPTVSRANFYYCVQINAVNKFRQTHCSTHQEGEKDGDKEQNENLWKYFPVFSIF